MSEQNNENGAEQEIPETEVQPEVVEETLEPEAEQRIPLYRLNEVIAQREAAAAERDRVAYENQVLKQQLASQQQIPAKPAQTAAYWEQYTDPNTRALARLSYESALEAQKVANAPILERLQRQEVQLEKQEAADFWSRFPQVPAELKQKTEEIYARAKGMGVDRDTALTFAYGESQRANLSGQVSNAAATVAQQSAVNRAAKPSISQGAAQQASKPQASSAAAIRAEIEKEHARLLKG